MILLVATRIAHSWYFALVQFVCMNVKSNDVFAAIAAELQMAASARFSGNEGKARVCARRAAGWAIRGWQERQGILEGVTSAHRLLHEASLDRSFPSHIRAAAAHLVLRITEDHELPINADVLDDARVLVEFFLASDDDRYHTQSTQRTMTKNA